MSKFQYKLRGLHIAIAGGILALGIGGGLMVSVALGGVSNVAGAVGNSGTNFPTNAAGQTYGSDSGVSQNRAPDLILTYATNGDLGYVYRNALWAADGTDVSSPAQALTYMARTTPNSIPVYEENGTTIIGSFVIGAPASSGTPQR
jgi:hypothetical protein